MSGGSHNYIYYKIEEELVGQMEDEELDDLMNDIATLAHDLEWYHNSDKSRDDYRETVQKFKSKWFKGNREERLKGYVDKAIDDVRQEMYKLLAVSPIPDKDAKRDDAKTFDIVDAFMHLIWGRKIRQTTWVKGEYIELSECNRPLGCEYLREKEIINQDGGTYPAEYLFDKRHIDARWEDYKEE